ncbi:MAG: B12-binding domain-containing radical SAM protein, partial [Planctomycetota bacterium]
EEALTYADAVVIGDAEGVWEQLVRDAQRGKLQRVYRQPKQPPLEGLKLDRSIFRDKRYKPLVPVQYGRGCRYACDFCSIHAIYGNSVRQRPVREVIAEIEQLGRKYIFMVDDNIHVPGAEALFRALVPLNVRWVCQTSIDIAQDTRLLDLMARSGCMAVTIGFESLNKDNLRQMKKRQDLGDYMTAIRRLQDRGIMIYGTFVFGYDGDTVDSFDATVDFALRSKFCLANFNPLTPTPGAKLYERLHAEGRLIHDRWWLDPNYRYGQATFHPRSMTADQLTEGCFHARQQFNRYSSIFSRALSPGANCRSLHHLAAFVASNLISRKEIFGKQGHRLGSSATLDPIPEAP